MRAIFYLPPLPKASGGTQVIVQLASHLYGAGYETILAVNGTIPENLQFTKQPPVCKFNDLKFLPEDRFIVPEGWPNALAPALAAGSNCCVFAQNWAFMHGRLPNGVRWFNLPVKMLAISHPVQLFLKQTLGIAAPIISPALNTTFYSDDNISGQFAVRNTITVASPPRIAWMPRKNKGTVRQISDIMASMLALHGMPAPEWVEISNCSLAEVAAIMRSCHIFLATGYPEGFGLPPLEAMACGCLVAGFTGLGGWDYMRQAKAHAYRPPFHLPDAPWGANGFFAADGDIFGATLALFAAIQTAVKADAQYREIISNGLQTARYFSAERQKKQILSIWQDEKFWHK